MLDSLNQTLAPATDQLTKEAIGCAGMLASLLSIVPPLLFGTCRLVTRSCRNAEVDEDVDNSCSDNKRIKMD